MLHKISESNDFFRVMVRWSSVEDCYLAKQFGIRLAQKKKASALVLLKDIYGIRGQSVRPQTTSEYLFLEK